MKKRKKNNKLNKNRILIIVVICLLTIVIFIKNKSNHNYKKSIENSNEIVSENIEENIESKNTTNITEKADFKPLGESGLPVLMYHFFYDKNVTTGEDGNWIEISKFEEQIKYLSENNYYFPNWQEVEDYIDGKNNLPEKSVVITVDDGDDSFFELAVPILQKYDVNATSFVVTAWYGYRAQNKEKNVDYESHSNDMHKAGSNGKGVMLSWNYDKIKDDVTLSSETLGGATVFCYPFGQYNDLDENVLKDNGYKLSFTTKARKSKTRRQQI